MRAAGAHLSKCCRHVRGEGILPRARLRQSLRQAVIAPSVIFLLCFTVCRFSLLFLPSKGKKRRPRRGVFTKGFYFLEKFGIVVNIGYAVFLCFRWLKLANAVVHNLYSLASATINFFCLWSKNTINNTVINIHSTDTVEHPNSDTVIAVN